MTGRADRCPARRVNRYQGLFYFDASFRPVPLEQHFLGVKGKPGSMASRNGLDNAAFDKVRPSTRRALVHSLTVAPPPGL